MIVIFAVLFNPFLSIVNALSPNPDELTINFIDGKNKLLVAGTIGGQMTNLLFNKASLTLDKSVIENEVTDRRRTAIVNWDRYASFTAYRIQAGEGGDSANFEINTSWLPRGQSGSDTAWLNQVGPFILIGALPTLGGDHIYHNLGMYWYQNNSITGAGWNPNVVKPTDTNAQFKRIWQGATFESALKNGRNKTRLIALNEYLQDSGAGLGIVVRDIMSGTGLKDSCLQLELAWFSLQQMVRDFFIPTPDAANPSINPNWSNKRDTWWERWTSGESTRNVLRAGMEQAASTMNNPAITAFVELTKEGAVDQFGITKDGATNAVAISDKAKQIKELIEQIKSSPEAPLSGGTADWKCGTVVNISTFKWNKDLNAPAITDLDKLTEAIDKLVEQFKAFKENMDAPVGEQSECDKISEGGSIMLLIKKGICAVLEVMKAWADAFVLWAIGWMKASLGVSDSTKDMEIPDLEPGTGDVLSGGAGGAGGTAGGGGAGGGSGGGSSSPTTPVNLTNAGAVAIPSTEVAKIRTEAEKNSGIISARIFETDSTGKVDTTKGMNAQIKIVSPGQAQTAVEVKAQNTLSYTKSLLMFSADGKNYKIPILKTGTSFKFDPATIAQMSGTIPDLPGSDTDDDTANSDNGSSSETTTPVTYNFRITGWVAPTTDTNFTNYKNHYFALKTLYQSNMARITVQYGASNEVPYKGAITIFQWDDASYRFKFKVVGRTALVGPINKVHIKIGNGRDVLFYISPDGTDINNNNYRTYLSY